MLELTNDDQEKLWRVCKGIISSSGARAAMFCDAAARRVLVSVGEARGDGQLHGVKQIAPGERLVRGDAGNIYGVDFPGGLLLAVLHDEGALERVRSAAAQASREVQALLAAPPEKKRKQARKKKAPGRTKRPPARKTRPAKKHPAKKR